MTAPSPALLRAAVKWERLSSGSVGSAGFGQPLECDWRTEAAADQQHPAHAALHVLSCLLITLKPGMNSIPAGPQVLLLPSTQPCCFLPSSCLESSQGRAPREGLQAQNSHVKQSHRRHVGSSQFSLSTKASKCEF